MYRGSRPIREKYVEQKRENRETLNSDIKYSRDGTPDHLATETSDDLILWIARYRGRVYRSQLESEVSGQEPEILSRLTTALFDLLSRLSWKKRVPLVIVLLNL